MATMILRILLLISILVRIFLSSRQRGRCQPSTKSGARLLPSDDANHANPKTRAFHSKQTQPRQNIERLASRNKAHCANISSSSPTTTDAKCNDDPAPTKVVVLTVKNERLLWHIIRYTKVSFLLYICRSTLEYFN